MARPQIVRSMNYELVEGATDGSVKKANPNRSDFGYDRTDETRAGLYNGVGGYGINNAGLESLSIIRGVVGPL
jgi:hypothetical protein